VRIAFFGTPEFAVPTLEALLGSIHEVVLVVTQPDRPRGRGQRVSAGPVKQLAEARGIPVRQPDKLTRDPWEAEFAAFQIDLGVVAAYGRILPDWLLALPRFGLINVHASLLPKYRGASPIHRAVMNGDSVTGVTIMRVVKALDAGAMLATGTVPIGPDDRTDVVERALARIGGTLLVDTVDRLAAGPVREVPQRDGDATYAPRLRKEEGLVDW
jgi:methionyl-tRNA formyltransferase